MEKSAVKPKSRKIITMERRIIWNHQLVKTQEKRELGRSTRHNRRKDGHHQTITGILTEIPKYFTTMLNIIPTIMDVNFSFHLGNT